MLFLLLVNSIIFISERLCRKEEFECINEGLSPRAKQCIHESLLCDGNRDCDDGSDEYISNCPKIDEGEVCFKSLMNNENCRNCMGGRVIAHLEPRLTHDLVMDATLN